jgi:hypothetical protein
LATVPRSTAEEVRRRWIENAVTSSCPTTGVLQA